MSEDKDTFAETSFEAGGIGPAQSLLKMLREEFASVEDINNNLSMEYDETIYEKFAKRFIKTRDTFKATSKDLSNYYYAYINRSEKRKEAINDILEACTDVAQKFQKARDEKHLDYAIVTNSLEDLKYNLKNLQTIIEEQGKL